jgi:hypothetical protein
MQQKNNVVLMFLKPVDKHLKGKKEEEIKTKAKPKELVNQLNQYKKQIMPIDVAIKSNTEFKDCHLYSKIELDILNYVRQFEDTHN